LKSFPKKSLGQNYLTDENISRNIVKSFNCKINEPVIEIGAGQGALTRFLIKKANNITAVEIDSGNCIILRENFPGIKVIHGDFLKTVLKNLLSPDNSLQKFKNILNIQYNITRHILFS
jgi:16S rRNA (adenine1518-N6/adenine1519-N6)-dimethyltransferase